jgi:hypothetical protein
MVLDLVQVMVMVWVQRWVMLMGLERGHVWVQERVPR